MTMTPLELGQVSDPYTRRALEQLSLRRVSGGGEPGPPGPQGPEGPAGPMGPDEVWVGPSAPVEPLADVWIDTDEPDPLPAAKFYSRVVVGVDHSDGTAGWQVIQGFSAGIAVVVTRAGAIYRCRFSARALSSATGFTHSLGVGLDGANPDIYQNCNIGYGPYTIPQVSFDLSFSVGSHVLRPMVNHASGSGFLTINAGMQFIVEEVA